MAVGHAMTDDKRDDARRRTLKGARIVYGGGAFTIDCTIRNISTTGARLQVPTSITVPDTFTLIELQGGAGRAATVIWRKGDTIGVRFT
jgi:PilZ domain